MFLLPQESETIIFSETINDNDSSKDVQEIFSIFRKRKKRFNSNMGSKEAVTT
jgi:hypothetical protein